MRSKLTPTRATSTLTFCNTRAARKPRDAITSEVQYATSTSAFTGLPYYIQPYPSEDVSSACSCLSLYAPSTNTTSAVTVIGSHVYETNVSCLSWTGYLASDGAKTGLCTHHDDPILQPNDDFLFDCYRPCHTVQDLFWGLKRFQDCIIPPFSNLH